MKLHLPTGLRKALLVCLAAVALPAATIPTTVASASGIAAAFLIASQRAKAEAINHTGSDTDVRDLSGAQTYESITISDGEVELDIAPGDATKVTVTGELAGTGGTLTLKRKDGDGAAQLVLEQGGNFNGTLRITEGVQSNGWANPIVEMGGSLTLGSLELDSCGGRFQFFTTTPSTLTITNKVTLDGSDYLKIDASAHGAIGGTHKVTFTGGVSVEAGSELHISDAEVIVGPSQKITSAGTVEIVGNITGGDLEVTGGKFKVVGNMSGGSVSVTGGELSFSGDLGGDLTLNSGAKLGGGDKVTQTTISGNFTSNGDFEWYGVTAGDERTLTLSRGGKITGNFTVGWGGVYVIGDDLELQSIKKDQPGNSDAKFQKKDDATDAAVVFNLGEGDKTLSELLPTVTSFDVGIGATGAHKLTIADYTVKGAAKAKEGATLEFTGASAVEGKLMGATGTTVNVASGGTLSVATLSFEGGLSLAGELSVSAWEIGKSLTSLTFAEGGHLKLGGDITEGAINLGAINLSNNADITLSGVLTTLKLSGALTANEHTLTIHLTDDFLATVQGQGYQLFSDDSWYDHVAFATEEGSSYGGKVEWNDDHTGIKISSAENLYWGLGNGDLTTLTFGLGGSVWSEQQGQSGSSEWAAGKNVYLEAVSDRIGVTVTDEASMASLHVASGSAIYTFTGGKPVTVTGEMVVGSGTTLLLNEATLNVGKQVNIESDAKVQLSGSNSFGSLTGDGTLAGFSCIVSLGAASSLGTLDVSWNSTVELGGDLSVNAMAFDNNSKGITFRKKEGVMQDVFLVLNNATFTKGADGDQTGLVLNWHDAVGGNSKGTFTFTDVGLRKKGNNVITLDSSDDGGAPSDGWWTIQALVVEEGGVILNHGATLAGQLDVQGQSSLVVQGTHEVIVGGEAKSSQSSSVDVRGVSLILNGKATLEGTLRLFSGSMTVSGGGSSISNLEIAGTEGSLVINAETKVLQLTGAGSLTSLTLAAGAELTVSKGNFAITNALTWGEGSVLKLEEKLTIDLTGVSSLTAPEGAHKLKLKIDLASDALDQNNSYQLFSGWREDWNSADLFDFTIDGQAVDTSMYADLRIGADGRLTWTEQVEPGSNFTWSGAGTAVTLGDSISGDGWSATGAVDDTKTVTLEGSAAVVTVAVDGGDDNVVTMKSLTVGNAAGPTTTYTFSAESDQTLKVSAGMTINDSSVFGEHVTVDATGSTVAVNGGTTKFEDGSTLTAGKLTISGQGTVVELHSAAGSVNVQGTLANDESSGNVVGVNGNGGIEIEDGATLRLSSNVFSRLSLAYAKGLGTVDIAIGGAQTGDWSNWFGCLFPAVAYDGAELTLRLSNNTNLKLNGNLGDRLQNAKKVDIENGSSVIVEVKDGGGQDLFNVGTGHVHIEGSGADGAGALVIGQAETISWAFVLDGAATVTNTAAMTLTGELDTGSDGKTLTKKGNGTLEFGDSFSTKAGSGGTVAVEEGTLKLSNTTNANALQNHTIVLTSGSTLEGGITGTVKALTGTGTLNVTGGKLTLGTADGSTLTNMQLAASSELVVSEGSFTIQGGWTWGAGSKLTLSTNGQQITLSDIETLNGGSSDNKLTIHLDSAFFGSVDGETGIQLFSASGFTSGWEQYFTFEAEGRDLRLDSTGKLTWAGESVEDGGNLYWPGNGESNNLTWGTGGDNQWATGADQAPGSGWTTNSNVYLGATGAATVTLKDASIEAASITFTAANATDGYTFTSDAAEGSSTLLVKGNMTNNPEGSGGNLVKAVFDEKVNVRVMGNFISTGKKGEFTFRKKLQVDGLLQLWNSSVLQLDEGGEVGTLDASWNNVQIKLGGDLKVGEWFFEGGNFGGHQCIFEKTGEAEEVFIEVGKVTTNPQYSPDLSDSELRYSGNGSLSIGSGVGIRRSTGTLTFGGSNTFAVGGSYAAVEGGNMVFNVDATAGMNVEIGAGSTITVNEGKRLSATGSLKGTGGTLSLQAGATASFGSADATASLTSLQLAEGSSLHVGGGNMLNIDTLTLSGPATIELSGTDSGKIKLGHGIAGDFTLTITLTGLTDEESTSLLSNGYQLFDADMSSEILDGLETLFDGGKLAIDLGECTYDVALDATGKLTFTNDSSELTHTGSGAEFIWDNASSTWDSNQAFAAGNSVKFTGSGANIVKLGISGETTVKNMTVDATGATYTFTADGDNTLTVRTKLDLKSAATFQVGTNVQGEMTGSGALTVDTKTFTLANRMHSWTGVLTVQNGGSFSLAGTVSAGKLTVGANGGRIDLSEAGAVLTVTGDIAGEGNQLTLAGGGKLDWTGGTGTLGSVSVENGEFAIGGTLTMDGNITLGQNGKLSGSGTINKSSEGAYVQFQVSQGAPNVQKTVDAWVTEKLGGVTLGEGVGLQKTGEGILNFQDTGGTLNYDLDIAEGAVQFNGNNYTLKGKLTGQGNFNVATADKRYMLTMEKGGSISGDMALSGWGARLSLGDDFEVGGVAQLDPEHGGNEGSTKLQIGLDRYRTITGDGSLTVNVTGEATKEVDGLVIEQGVTLVKKGTGTQKFTTSEGTNEAGNGKTQLQGNVKVDEGVLEFEGAGSVISGALSNTGGSTGGTLKLTNGDLTISGGGKHGGALELTAGKITISGAALEVGTFKATTGELDVQSNLTIGTGANEGLSTLKIASGTTVTLKGGTLKADTLDLTDTQGASLSIDMTGQAKLDFGGITLGADGKLAIKLTGDNGDMGGYQLFEESTFASVWNALVTDDKTWEDVFDITVNGENDKVLGLNREGWIDMETTGMEWNGGGTWSDTSGSQWEGGKTPNGEDVRFTKQGAQKDETVRIEGVVAPRNVYVDGGEYTFTQQGGTEGGLNMSSDDGGGVLRVRDAKLTLKLKNTAIPEIQLKDQGTLVLAHDGALPGDSKIKFQGGVLEYSNAPLANSDVSRQVASAEEGSEAVVKVSVDGTTYTDGVTWGSTSTAVGDNSGLKLALDEEGIEKSGAGDFTLAWRGTGDTHEGSIAVNEGSLTLNVSNATTLSGEVSGSGTLKITGREVTLSGGNNTVANIQVDSGATLKAGRANALGGADTTLTLNGGNLSGNNVSVNAGQVRVMEAATLSGVTLAGTVTGEEAMSVGSGTAGLSGDISGYTGELTGTGTWKLSGKALEKPVTNAVSGSGIVSFAGESVYGGDVKGSVTLEGGGENGEQLIITSRTTSNGAKLKGQVTLGNQGEQAAWQGSTLVNGEITLANVELAAGGISTKRNAKLYVSTATSGVAVAAAYEARAARRTAEVNVNGMSGEQLDGITINEHGRLTGITGSYTADANHKLELHFAGENVGESATVGEGENALIAGEGGFSLNAESKDNVELWLSSDAVASIIGRLSESDGENGEMADAYLHLLQGGDLTIGEVTLSDLKGSDAELLERLDVTEVRVEGGSIRLVGTAADVFVVNETSTLTDAAALGTSKSTVLSTPGVELTLNLDGGTADDPEDNRAIVNNLLGVTGSQLHLQNSSQDDPTGANRLEVTFHNAKVSVNDKDKYPSVDDTTVEGQHTTFNGSIDGGEGVAVKKTGFGTLSVGGDYTLEDGTTTITAGALKLRGAKNTINGLAFDYADVQQQKDKGEDYRGLLLDGGRTTVRGSITEGEKKTGEIVMSSGAELVLNGESDLEGTSIMGDDSTKLTLAVKGEQRASLKLRGGKNVSLGEDGKRTVLSGVDVEVQEGASMEVSGIDAAMKGSDLTVQRGELKLTEGATMTGGSATLGSSNSLLDLGSSAQNSLTALNGTGTLKSAAGGDTTITGEAGPSVFSGKLASTVEGAGAGKLTISRNAEVTLDNVDTSAAGGNTANAWDVEVQDGGRLTLDVSKSKAGEQVVLGDVNFGSGNTVNLKVNSSNYNLEGSTVKGNTLSFGENTMVMLEAAAGDIWNGSGGRELTLGEWGAVKGGGEDIDVQLRGDGFIFADVKGVVVEGRTVIVQLEGAKENKFERAMPNGEKNAMAGATMVWGSLKDKSELDSFVDMLTNSESDYARVIHGLVTQMDNGQTGSLQNALASVAGSSVATIGPAVMEDLHRQIKTIRNRTTTMATEATYDNYDQLPLWHAWINGEGGYHKMDADSQAPGYTLNNWGGTVGVDVDMSPQATMGLAITAMYGNLKPESVDAATGNVDMTYLSGFVRATGGAWIHTFVMSGGKAEVQLDRTVNYGTGSYRTRGSTDGYVLGAMYEVGYTRLFSASGTFALQPVFNVEARHASIKGYTETGSDAGLHVDEISQDVVTFGLGARMQSLVGENSFNRTAIFEARLLLKADVGDRSGTADNTLLGAATRAEVESVEVGAIGVEVGAGLTIPLGSSSGSIFMDASVECRRGWTSLDASAGYRISF